MSGHWTVSNSGPDYRAGDDEPVTITEFLSARLDEDEAGWKAVAAREDGVSEPISHFFGKVLTARMLREVAAKRAILALHSPEMWNPDDDCPDQEEPHCRECTKDDDLYKPQMYPCQTLKLLAIVHSDHPDYDEAWRPR